MSASVVVPRHVSSTLIDKPDRLINFWVVSDCILGLIASAEAVDHSHFHPHLALELVVRPPRFSPSRVVQVTGDPIDVDGLVVVNQSGKSVPGQAVIEGWGASSGFGFASVLGGGSPPDEGYSPAPTPHLPAAGTSLPGTRLCSAERPDCIAAGEFRQTQSEWRLHLACWAPCPRDPGRHLSGCTA